MCVRFIDLVRAALLAVALTCAAVAAHAQSPTPPPDKIDRLIELLSDPEVKAWLAAQDAKQPTPPPADAGDASAMAPAELSSALDRIRVHIQEMAAAIPTLPAQFDPATTSRLMQVKDQFDAEGVFLSVVDANICS